MCCRASFQAPPMRFLASIALSSKHLYPLELWQFFSPEASWTAIPFQSLRTPFQVPKGLTCTAPFASVGAQVGAFSTERAEAQLRPSKPSNLPILAGLTGGGFCLSDNESAAPCMTGPEISQTQTSSETFRQALPAALPRQRGRGRGARPRPRIPGQPAPGLRRARLAGPQEVRVWGPARMWDLFGLKERLRVEGEGPRWSNSFDGRGKGFMKVYGLPRLFLPTYDCNRSNLPLWPECWQRSRVLGPALRLRDAQDPKPTAQSPKP